MEKGHREECGRYEWCFFCAFQSHVERVMTGDSLPFSVASIVTRLPPIGGNDSHGQQEDVHEFIRLLVNTLQNLCIEEFGGEEEIDSSSQETTLIQHIFGGCFQSQVICTNCNMLSTRYEHLLDLTVEIQGNSSSLEGCLEQHTRKECLYGDNMYKCDRCNALVKAWKRLCVRQAPNILTIAFKRYQGGSFRKLNKRITFPETLDLGPYMTRPENGTDIYKLYAVVVHVNFLNLSSSGHYFCYVKGYGRMWYKIDDSEVEGVDLNTVLSQRAYMLFYSRVNARPSCLEPIEALQKDEHQIVDTTEVVVSHGDTSQGYVADDYDYDDPLSYQWDSARDDEMADAGLSPFYPRENLSGSIEFFDSWINDPVSAEAPSSALEDYYADTSSLNEEASEDYRYAEDYSDRLNTVLYPERDLLQGLSRTSSLNDIAISSEDDEGEEQVESLQEPSCPEETMPEELIWEDPTWKPVFSQGLDEEGLKRRSKKRLSESRRLSRDDASDEKCEGSPKRKMDDEEVQSTATLNIDDSTSPDAPQQPVQDDAPQQLVQDVTEKEEMDAGDLDKSPNTA